MAEPEGTAPEKKTPEPGAAGTKTAPPPSIDELRTQLRAELATELKAATGLDSIEALKAARDKEAADKLAEQGEFKKLAEQAQAELAQVRARFERAQIRNALLSAGAASVDPDVVQALLSGAAKVDAAGAVTIGGKTPAEAVAELLQAKPHLARPVGGQGSGAGGGGAAPAAQTMTMAQLGELRASNPAAYQAEMTRRAGGK
ncbi:hypothetical protein [uncultured Thiodictyon sp.]|uniref:hypothetical protein n=1 Tax=uncultured Thiodictyon sp. TaxID=1846217 RepID=UPI0025D336E5|nr:hypothetical protein [uncultured Thiodictyon sp.]